MNYHWFTTPTVVVFSVLLLTLVFIVACGGSATPEPVIVEKEVIKEVEKPINVRLKTLAVKFDNPVFTDAVPYVTGGAAHQVMNTYLPEAPSSERFPGLIHLHHGGWEKKDRHANTGDETMFNNGEGWGYYYASRGVAVFSLDYQLAAAGSPSWPNVIQDIVCAVQHIRANADTYMVDPDKLAVIGGSAGGHLAALVGVLDGSESFAQGACYTSGVSTRVQMAIVIAGHLDFEMIGQENQGSAADVETLVGATYAANPTLWDEASPPTYASADDPLFFITHGDQDPKSSYAQAQSFHDSLVTAGATSTFFTVETNLSLDPKNQHPFWFEDSKNEQIRREFEPKMANLFGLELAPAE